jgi:hypothetical protein
MENCNPYDVICMLLMFIFTLFFIGYTINNLDEGKTYLYYCACMSPFILYFLYRIYEIYCKCFKKKKNVELEISHSSL